MVPGPAAPHEAPSRRGLFRLRQRLDCRRGGAGYCGVNDVVQERVWPAALAVTSTSTA